MSDIDIIKKDFDNKFSKIITKDDLQNLKSEYFGKNGIVTAQFKRMNSLDESSRKDFAKKLNFFPEIYTIIRSNLPLNLIISFTRTVLRNFNSFFFG